jgi:hypothetical protein
MKNLKNVNSKTSEEGFRRFSDIPTLEHDRPDLSSERESPKKDKTVTLKKKSLVKSPRFGLDTKAY